MADQPSRSSINAAPSFRFVVAVNDAPYGVFTECSLPVVDWHTDPVTEGGLNTHVHTLIGRRKETRFTLKNGVGTGKLVSWYLATMAGDFTNSDRPLRRSVTITLKDSRKKTVMTWHIREAFPIKWTGPQLNTGDNTVAIQTLEFAGGEVTITPGEAWS
jgi:phage tail-like protein